jgi:transposase InsO family protein
LTACNATVADLRADYNLKVGDSCPVCQVKVGLHLRGESTLPVNNTSLLYNGGSFSTSSSSSSAARLLVKLHSSKLLPVWDSHNSICRTFLEDLSRTLRMTDLPEAEWYRAFSFVVSDRHSADWIDKHITQLRPSFEDACETFKSHFESASADIAVAKEFETCSQQPKETVQQYSDRFIDIVNRYGVSTDNPLVLRQFILRLSPTMRSKYFQALETKQLIEPDFTIEELEELCEFVIRLDVLYQARQAAMQQAAGSTSGSSQSDSRSKSTTAVTSTSRMKKCRYHPSTSSHSTEECRLGKAMKGAENSKNFKSTSAPSTYGNKPIQNSSVNKTQSPSTGTVCYHCGKNDHIRPNCPELRSQRTQLDSNREWRSRAPSQTTSAQNKFGPQNTFQPRRSEREFKQPERYTPSNPTARATDPTAAEPPTDDSAPEAKSCTALQTITELPCESLTPKAELLGKIQDFVYRCLVDSGSSISYIDPMLASRRNLPIRPQSGHVNLAAYGTTAPRTARTDPVEITFLFAWSKHDLPSKTLQVEFDLLPQPEWQPIIVGRDLIPVLFGESIPCDFLPAASEAQPHARSSYLSQAFPTVIDDIVPLPYGAKNKMSDMEGVGAIPLEEFPERVSVFTSTEKEVEYSHGRDLIMSDPIIQSAIGANSAIDERDFCNLPESIVHLEIDESKSQKVYRRQYPVAEVLKPQVTEIIERWFQTGKIKYAPPHCIYNSPICVAPKKDADGKLTGVRVCLDVRALNNAAIVNDRFPIPKIRSCLESFANCDKFGEFDLAEAYLQLRLSSASQKFTAFTWNGHQFVFVGCPFGLALLPSHFQRVMSFIFADLPFTFPYLDNLPFASRSWEEHRDHALVIINRLTQYNLRIKPGSIKIGYPELKCLGHLLTGTGVSISPPKLEKALDWPTPRTGEQLQKFLGFAGFLRQHVRHYADLTGPLHEVKNCKNLNWTDILQQSFDTTKHALATAPILQFPDFEKRFVIATDASNTGIGGVLFQPQTEENTIMATNIVNICSKKLHSYQRNYPAYKKELWAVVYCLRQFHSFIWGRTDLVILTDHKPLVYILTSENLSPALQQWLDVILDYRFVVQHRPGILNQMPDALSRMYAALYPTTWGVPTADVMSTDADGNLRVNFALSSTVAQAVASLSEAGGGVSRPLPQSTICSAQSMQVNVVQKDHMDLAVELERRGMKAPPEQDRLSIIEKLHFSGGHFGRDAIYRSLWSKKVWWPNMRQDIETVLSNCDPCARFTVTKQGFHPASFITASGPWDHIQVDTSVHLPTSPRGHTSLLVVIDVFTGFIQLRPLKNHSAETVARKLWKVFTILGLPKILQSDNGTEFSNEVLRALVKLTGVEQRFISPYNPRADGKVERSIGTVMGVIKKMLHGTNHDWPLFVPLAQMVFNQKVSALTNSSPFTLMYGRTFNEFKDYTGEHVVPLDLNTWKHRQQQVLSLIYPAISDKIMVAKNKMVERLNQYRRQLKENSIPAGAIVMLIDPLYLNDPSKKPKWEPKYIGPYTVVRRARNGAYVLKDMTGDILDRRVPADQLKLVKRQLKSPPEKSEFFEVAEVLDHRGDPGAYEYLVRWKGYDESENSWVPQQNFQDTACITAYWKSRPPDAFHLNVATYRPQTIGLAEGCCSDVPYAI